MNISIISLTEKGRMLSARIAEFLSVEHDIKRYCFSKHSDSFSEPFDSMQTLVKEIFPETDGIIFICACGIAVRMTAPCIVSKVSDPAVIAVDDCGKFVISVLSGHIGGANRLAEIIAENIKAVPVITTATDTGRKFSPDSFAVANNMIISDMHKAKKIASAVLDGEKIGLLSDYECINIPNVISAKITRYGIYIGTEEISPFPVTLRLIPKNIIVGMGCKRGTSCGTISRRISECLSSAGIPPERVCGLSTIDIKSNEKGLIEYCTKNKIKPEFFTANELMGIQGDFTVSEFVRQTVGVDNVCERSAVKSGGRLIMRKNAKDGVTVALAEKDIVIDFERKIL
ncbi:MAG: cobalt-precorrin 5A hydrolase [Ruminococcus flavefaciens]|nr:cobalt-precorrin 5A hydrolase [Ruminococcus flavefaciens]